jgi:hypothetical protein
MRLTAALSGDLRRLLAEEVRAAEKGVAAGVRQAGQALKAELRQQVTSAGLGWRLAAANGGEAPAETLSCNHCASDFPRPSGPGRPPKWCSLECKKKAARARIRVFDDDEPGVEILP